jgi:hypothetical protein
MFKTAEGKTYTIVGNDAFEKLAGRDEARREEGPDQRHVGEGRR